MSLSSLHHFFEPALYDFQNSYWIDACPNTEKMEQYLLSKIISDPMDLESHARRVLLNVQLARQEQLIGALQDVFIVLEEKGESMKRMLLTQSETVLNADVLAPFYDGLDKMVDFSSTRTQYSYMH